MENKEVLVEFNNVIYSYNSSNIPILDNISLKVYKNDFYGIIGPNGGGKTTMMKLMLGLLKPSSGNVRIFNNNAENLSSMIGYVPQEKNVNKGFPITVFDVALMGRLSKNKLFSKYSKYDKQIALQNLEKVEMAEYKDKLITELSGGQKQRVYIARALVSEPLLILLDEPTTGVDPKFHHFFYDLLTDINKSITVILISHDLECLFKNATKIAYVNRTIVERKKEDIDSKNIYDFYHTL